MINQPNTGHSKLFSNHAQSFFTELIKAKKSPVNEAAIHVSEALDSMPTKPWVRIITYFEAIFRGFRSHFTEKLDKFSTLTIELNIDSDVGLGMVKFIFGRYGFFANDLGVTSYPDWIRGVTVGKTFPDAIRQSV